MIFKERVAACNKAETGVGFFFFLHNTNIIIYINYYIYFDQIM